MSSVAGPRFQLLLVLRIEVTDNSLHAGGHDVMYGRANLLKGRKREYHNQISLQKLCPLNPLQLPCRKLRRGHLNIFCVTVL